MKLERWLEREAAKGHYPRRDYSAFIVYPAIIAVLAWIFFRRASVQEMMALWQAASPADKRISIILILGILLIFFVGHRLLKLLPTGMIGNGSGARGGLTGRELDILRRAQKQLTTDLRSIYRSVPRPARFTAKDYAEAAKRLRGFSSMRRDELLLNTDTNWMKILILSGAVHAVDASVRKTVNLDAIEREAN